MPTHADVAEGLHALGFRASAPVIRAFLEQSSKERAFPIETCERLVAIERRERDIKNLERRTRLATLGKLKPLDRFDWNHPRTIDRGLCEELLDLDFVERHENILFRGPSGVGKTTLAKNIGLEALKKGYTVRFATLATILADLSKQDSLPALERRLNRFCRPEVLIVDELGYVPCDSRSADLLYNLIGRRHEERSTVITTNLSFKQWGGIFPGAACVVALVDRFAQHCHYVDIDADSWREKNALKSTDQTAPKKKKGK